jgi:hypothetical protein
MTFDGSGKGTVFGETISFNGAVTSGVTGTFTYTVNADCTGSDTVTMSTGQTADFNFLVKENGASFFSSARTPGSWPRGGGPV